MLQCAPSVMSLYMSRPSRGIIKCASQSHILRIAKLQQLPTNQAGGAWQLMTAPQVFSHDLAVQEVQPPESSATFSRYRCIRAQQFPFALKKV